VACWRRSWPAGTNREIGERLYISEKTVGVHVGNILAKLGVSGRVEAATVALRLGLVDDLAADAKRTRTGQSGSRSPWAGRLIGRRGGLCVAGRPAREGLPALATSG